MTPFCLVLCWLLLVCPLSSDRCTLTNIQSLSFSMLSSPSFGQPILLRDSLVTSTVITLNPSKTLFLYNLFLYLCQLPALRFYFFPVFHWNATSPKINLSYRKKKKKKRPSSFFLSFLLETLFLSPKCNLSLLLACFQLELHVKNLIQ